MIILKSPLDPERKMSLQKQLFHYFRYWWPDNFAMNIWQYSPIVNEILLQKYSLSLLATKIKILVPETLQVEDSLTALNSFFCQTTGKYPNPPFHSHPSLSYWKHLMGEGTVGLFCGLQDEVAVSRVLPQVGTRGRNMVN